MMVKRILILLLCGFLGSTCAFWQSTINTGLEGMRRAECQSIARSQLKNQFKSYCKVGRITVIGLDVGRGLFRLPNNQLSFNGNVLRTSDVTFMTEQDGYGSIVAKFNGAVLKCSGHGAMKQKTCVIPRANRPWSGQITVTVFGTGGYNPSTSYYMRGTPVCLNSGYDGDNCDTDINECEKYKDKRLCQWQNGCVNTLGSYRCTCPAGFKVSVKDFRLCDPDPPQIYSKPVTLTAMFGATTVLPCQHKAQPLAIVKWQLGSRVIAIKQANGATQTINDAKLTVRQDGGLVIKSVAYGDAGDFFCVVLNIRFLASVKHTLKVESVPLMDVQHLISGNYTKQHAYHVGDNVTIDCQVIAMPVPVISWTKNSQALQTTQRLKVG
ncbi:uncharacterized protein LOC116287883 isoform X2 [Actinia tenebrosa]|uniref:Uncharacterized protein LOC116287883 isoform X2 n=1 Tax=Actinia tenebrosa TaxID=6105 RepID=A0A6P8H231_ACTTE|nr:uncharacterized protein LOC116287883 isoform X2 [Actinia tenebrosa]